ncbi:MAG: class I SAM-dependent methyltransferase [Actinomycetota bacterium]|nr:class I SAM-dependent methyltransferase [Actinomycetota bacterium]
MTTAPLARVQVTHGGSITHKPVGVEYRLKILGRMHELRGCRLLEIGAADGEYAAVLADAFDQVVAIDLVPAQLPAATKRGVPTAQMSASRLGFPRETFDVVLAIEVLEHVESVADVAAETHRVLRPGGVLCVTSPNRWFPLEMHTVRLFGRRFLGRYLPFLPYLPWVHRRVSDARNFKRSELRSVLGPIGFEEVAVDYVMPPFDGWKFGRRYLRPVVQRMEKSPARVVAGVSVAAVYRRL